MNKVKRTDDEPCQPTRGLYQEAYEHDACGVGMIVNIHGNKSHQLVDDALRVLENMRHRGAEVGRDGDGAGIMLQIPHEFILLQGIPVPEKGKYGTGLVFLPKDVKAQQEILSVMIEETEREGLQLMHLRTVPTCPDVLGEAARKVEPAIRQVFITGVSKEKAEALPRMLYIIRKKIERRITHPDFYICSLSNTNLVYKGMLTSGQLRRYFPDLSNPYLTSGLALVHSRFSTNTFPTWSLAQPFRLLAHNGEINTIRGNRGWMKARESVLSSEALGNIKDISPIVEEGMSDSASLDNVFEFLTMSGLSLPQAMAILVPESFNDKNPISEDLKAFYEYHSILMEPWDGPAALLFSDGRYAGGMLDRNGLRPSRYTITKQGVMVVASEVGVMDFEPGDVVSKGRLQPGKILLIDTQEGKIYYDGEIKAALAKAHPYREWLSENRVQLEKLKSGRHVDNSVTEFEQKLVNFGIDGMEHGSMMDKETAAMIEAAGTYLVPTFCPYQDCIENDEETMLKKAKPFHDKLHFYQDRMIEGRRIILESKIKLGYGTDFVTIHNNYENGWEYGAWIRSMKMYFNDVDPFRVLKAATKTNAEICGVDKITGTLEVGKMADISGWKKDIYDENFLRSCGFVMKEGKTYEPEDQSETIGGRI